MTETRPTQEDLDRAAVFATEYLDEPERCSHSALVMARCYLDLAAENKALEERVRRYATIVHRLACASGTSAAAHPPTYIIEAALVDAAQEALAAKAGDPPVEGPEGPFPDFFGIRKETDTRASRRRAYVRDKAPVILAGIAACSDWEGATWDNQRARALEQAGLIFDETEPRE